MLFPPLLDTNRGSAHRAATPSMRLYPLHILLSLSNLKHQVFYLLHGASLYLFYLTYHLFFLLHLPLPWHPLVYPIPSLT